MRLIGLLFPIFAIIAPACGDGSQSSNDTGLDGGNDTGATHGDSGISDSESICSLLAGTVGFGVSSYGGVRDWALDAANLDHTPWDFLYVYILEDGMGDPENFRDWYVLPFVNAAQSIGATPVLTFYQLLDTGEKRQFSGNEAQIVNQCIEDTQCMYTYFENFIWLLALLAQHAPNAILHSEPDSWGFMIWAMGVEGNGDAESVDVQVASSGHPDVATFADNAAGLGKALLALRDKYAPLVLMGWHASDFRSGTRPEVVTQFYAKVGQWDLLITDGMHNETDESTWWLDWDETLLNRNLLWLDTVTKSTGLPMLMWQLPIGNYDYHLLGDGTDWSTLAEFAQAGVGGYLFEHINHNGADDPDDYRASGSFGAVPPASTGAGGTARDMKSRVTEYYTSPLSLPGGFPCP